MRENVSQRHSLRQNSSVWRGEIYKEMQPSAVTVLLNTRRKGQSGGELTECQGSLQ